MHAQHPDIGGSMDYLSCRLSDMTLEIWGLFPWEKDRRQG
jgi:hypothetical protein